MWGGVGVLKGEETKKGEKMDTSVSEHEMACATNRISLVQTQLLVKSVIITRVIKPHQYHSQCFHHYAAAVKQTQVKQTQMHLQLKYH